MNAFIKIISSLFLILALAGCGKENLSPKDSVNDLKQNELKVNSEAKTYGPYLDPKNDIMARIFGAIYDMRELNLLIRVLDIDKADIPDTAMKTGVFIFQVSVAGSIGLCIAIVIRIFIILLRRAFGNKPQDDDFLNISLTAIFGGFAYTFQWVFPTVLLLMVAINNGLFATTISVSQHNAENKLALSTMDPLKVNKAARDTWFKKLEEKRTNQAKAVKYSTNLTVTNMFIDDTIQTTSELAELITEQSKSEFATNKDTTTNLSDVFTFGFDNALLDLFKDTKYVAGVKVFDKAQYNFLLSDVLDFTSSNFEFALSKDIVDNNEDFATNADNSIARRDILLSGMKAPIADTMSMLNGIQTKIYNSLLAKDDVYKDKATYESEINALKTLYVSNFKGVENDIKAIKSEAQRAEITSAFFTFMEAKQMGLNADGSETDFQKIYNDWLDQPSTDWLSTICSVGPKQYELAMKEVDKLNRNTRLVAGQVWGDVDVSCVMANGKTFASLYLNAESDQKVIERKYANAKSHAIGLEVYFNIVAIAAKQAMYEVSGNVSNTQSECRQALLSGFSTGTLQLKCMSDAVHKQDLALLRLENPITVNYSNNTTISESFINEVALFGRPGTKNYTSEADQKSIMQHFKKIPSDVIYDREAEVTGSYTAILTQQDNTDSTLSDKIIEEIIDTAGGVVLDGQKFRAGLPQDLTIHEGMRKCGLLGCEDVYKPSFYEGTVVSGQRTMSGAAQCIAWIAGARAINSIVDVGDTLNAGSSSGVKTAANGVKGVAKTVKIASATANAAAETATIVCYPLFGLGIMEAVILPTAFLIILLGPVILIGVNAFALNILIWPALIVDTFSPRSKMAVKVMKYFMAMNVSLFVMNAGLLLSFAIMMLPFYSLYRLILSFGFTGDLGFISELATIVALIVINMTIWKYIMQLSLELVTSIMRFMELNFNSITNSSILQNQVMQNLGAQVVGGKVGQAANLLGQMTAQEISETKKIFRAIENENSSRKPLDSSKKQEQYGKDDATKDKHKTKLPTFDELMEQQKKADEKDSETKKDKDDDK